MSSYSRIRNDYDNNVVRVELNSTYRPRASSRATSREPLKPVSRHDTFIKGERPSNIVRSDTFILKHHNDESSDERVDCNDTFLRDKKKQQHDDKSNYSTYTRPGKKGNNERSWWNVFEAFRENERKK